MAQYFKNNKRAVYFALFTVIFLYKMSFDIYPFLDDYIQLKVYSLYKNPIKDVFIKIGTCASRPLANLLDIVFYSKFYNNLLVLYAIICAMHIWGVFLMQSNLNKINVKTSYVFCIAALINPLNAEAVYWISAADRIVVSFFFAQIAVYILCLPNYGKSIYTAVLFWLFELCSLLFYEQSAAVSTAMCLYFGILLKKRSAVFVTLFNLALVGIYYFLMRNYGVFANRGEAEFFNLAYFAESLKDCAFAAAKCIYGDFKMFEFKISALVVTAILLLLCASGYKNKSNCGICKNILFALGLCIVSFAPFTVLKSYVITFRSLFYTLLGAAIILDSLFNIINTKYIKSALFAMLCFAFVSCTNTEMSCYRRVALSDTKIINKTAQILNKYNDKENLKVCITGAKKCYTRQSVMFGEHILSVTSSDWAYTGAMRAKLNCPHLPVFVFDDIPDYSKYDVIIKIGEN